MSDRNYLFFTKMGLSQIMMILRRAGLRVGLRRLHGRAQPVTWAAASSPYAASLFSERWGNPTTSSALLGFALAASVTAVATCEAAAEAEAEGGCCDSKGGDAEVVTDGEDEEGHTVVNWSGTHQVTTSSFVEPETTAELEALVADAHSSGRSIRPLGSALSPNGIAFSSQGMVGLAQMDRIVSVDKDKKQVRAQLGARDGGVDGVAGEGGRSDS